MTHTISDYRNQILQSQEGYYGPYGGCFVPEVLIPALQEMAAAFEDIKGDPTRI